MMSRVYLILGVDAFIFGFSHLTAVILITGLENFHQALNLNIIGLIGIYLIIFKIFRYGSISYRNFSLYDIKLYLVGLLALLGVSFGTVIFLFPDDITKSIYFISVLLASIGVFGSRIIAHALLRQKKSAERLLKKATLIYGAGYSGQIFANAFDDSSIKGFVDDNEQLVGRLIQGVTVYPGSQIKDLVVSKNIEAIYIAAPKLEGTREQELAKLGQTTGVKVHKIPTLSQILVEKNVHRPSKEDAMANFFRREIEAGSNPDLSDRPNIDSLAKQTVLVTGGGGSIGSELCRQLVCADPAILIVVEISEFALYSIQQEINSRPEWGGMFIPILCSVQSEERLKNIFDQWRPNIVFHVAAYKHVGLVETNALEAVKNNVFGTLNLARQAQYFGVSKCILVSTDKAVRPANVMGVTKMLAELIFESFSDKSDTVFCSVRFGNVIESSGSVIPKFRKQIRDGGPVTVTDPKATRFFMTIPDAAKLVLVAAGLAKSGDIFVLDMGSPISILELAKYLIGASGHKPRLPGETQGDIEIIFTGLSRGEKLHEELSFSGELKPSMHSKIFRVIEQQGRHRGLDLILNKLDSACSAGDTDSLLSLMREYNESTI